MLQSICTLLWFYLWRPNFQYIWVISHSTLMHMHWNENFIKWCSFWEGKVYKASLFRWMHYKYNVLCMLRPVLHFMALYYASRQDPSFIRMANTKQPVEQQCPLVHRKCRSGNQSHELSNIAHKLSNIAHKLVMTLGDLTIQQGITFRHFIFIFHLTQVGHLDFWLAHSGVFHCPVFL